MFKYKSKKRIEFMKKKGKILIICPGLNNLGGTELETLITSKVFAENNISKKILIFSPKKVSSFIKNFIIEDQISFINYPKYFDLLFLLKVDQYIKYFLKKIDKDFSPLKYFYWLYKSIFYKYDLIYIITDSTQFFYAPMVVNFNPNKITIKFTNCFIDTHWCKLQSRILKSCNSILVTSQNQKTFFQEKFLVSNIKVIDVFIWNEEKLNQLNLKKSKPFIFGMLCRISKQKNIEDAIKLVAKLRDLGFNLNLLIKGPSYDNEYLKLLNELIIELNVFEFIEINTLPIFPKNIPDFYTKINAFLITSNFEGGPNTGIECMAAGIPVLSYDIGAMKERLEPFKDLLIAQNLESLVEKAIYLLNLDNDKIEEISLELKKHYLEHYSNVKKFQETTKIL